MRLAREISTGAKTTPKSPSFRQKRSPISGKWQGETRSSRDYTARDRVRAGRPPPPSLWRAGEIRPAVPGAKSATPQSMAAGLRGWPDMRNCLFCWLPFRSARQKPTGRSNSFGFAAVPPQTGMHCQKLHLQNCYWSPLSQVQEECQYFWNLGNSNVTY
jgi:hypothetical protein